LSARSLHDLKVGDVYEEEILFDNERVERFIAFSKDSAAIHTRKNFSEKKGFEGLVVHGLLLSTSFSRILGMEIPGENTVIGTVDLKFHEPVYVGDRVKYLVAVDRIIAPLGGVVLNLRITKSDGTVCVRGKSHCFFKKDVKEVRNGIRES